MAPLGTILAAAGAANLAARGFSYHDNGVRFISSGGINSGTFNVTELSISSGQDPQGKNQVGDSHGLVTLEASSGTNGDVNYGSDPGPSYPGFVFTAGRHKTDAVADFWEQRITLLHNTFGHDPDALNFAFIGDLDLDLPICGSKIHLPQIGLAQGSDSNGSNWWFGGKSCDLISNNQVYCMGYKPDGSRMGVTFQRGGKGQINDVYINGCKMWGYP